MFTKNADVRALYCRLYYEVQCRNPVSMRRVADVIAALELAGEVEPEVPTYRAYMMDLMGYKQDENGVYI
jgi:hypothetical protein